MKIAEGWKKRLEEMVCLILLIVGMFSCILLATWIVSAFIVILSDAIYPGAIAFIPKWVFLGSPLIFLFKTQPIKRLIEKIIDPANFKPQR